MDTIASLLGDEEDEDLEELAAPTSSEPEIPASSASSASDAPVPASSEPVSSEPVSSEPASSEEETVETDTPPSEEAEIPVASITPLEPEAKVAETAEEVETNEGFPKDLAVALPLTSHTAHSIANLVCMIYTRGSLLSKATGGNFKVNKALVDFILEEVEMATRDELIASINGQLEEEDKVLEGLKLEADRIIFDGFKNVPDFETCIVFTRLAENMNKMALTQKRVQVKEVTEPNEKYSLRIWLVRLGMSGGEYKEDRRILMKRLTGHSAFRTEADKEKWILARKKAKGVITTEEAEEVAELMEIQPIVSTAESADKN